MQDLLEFSSKERQQAFEEATARSTTIKNPITIEKDFGYAGLRIKFSLMKTCLLMWFLFVNAEHKNHKPLQLNLCT